MSFTRGWRVEGGVGGGKSPKTFPIFSIAPIGVPWKESTSNIGVDAYQTNQTSCTTFRAHHSATRQNAAPSAGCRPFD